MKKFSILVFLSGFLLLFLINNAGASVIWANGVSQSSGWFDAEKDLPDDGKNPVDDTLAQDDDDYMCWAATAANILSWSGWNATYTDSHNDIEDDIFEFFLNEDPIDDGGWMEYAWNFWFDGAETGGHFTDSTHTGYYTTAEYIAAYAEYMNDPDVMSRSESLLLDEYGVGFGVFRPLMGHAITLWGIEKDDQGNYLGVWVSDSDDDKTGGTDRRLLPDELAYYDVLWSDEDGEWYLQDFYGYNDVYINDIQALKLAAVPEPATMLLLGSGLIGLIGFRRKIF